MVELTKREKRLLHVLIAVVVVIGAYMFIITPVIEYKSGIETENESHITRLNKLDSLYSDYRKITGIKNKYTRLLENRQSVTTLVEENAANANILKNKGYLRDHPSNIQNKYKKVTTDVKFENVDMKSMINFLYKMENSNKLLRITYLRINQTYKDRNTYDATIKIDSYTSLKK